MLFAVNRCVRRKRSVLLLMYLNCSAETHGWLRTAKGIGCKLLTRQLELARLLVIGLYCLLIAFALLITRNCQEAFKGEVLT